MTNPPTPQMPKPDRINDVSLGPRYRKRIKGWWMNKEGTTTIKQFAKDRDEAAIKLADRVEELEKGLEEAVQTALRIVNPYVKREPDELKAMAGQLLRDLKALTNPGEKGAEHA